MTPITDILRISGTVTILTMPLAACNLDAIEKQVTGKTPATEVIAKAYDAPVLLQAPAPGVVSVPVVVVPPKQPCVPVFRVSFCDENGNSVEY